MAEKGKKKTFPYFPDFLTVPAWFVLCQLYITASSRFLGRCPALEKVSLWGSHGWARAEGAAAGTWDEPCRTLCKKCSSRAPPKAPTAANLLGFQISPAQHRCQSQVWLCQLSPGLLTRSKSRQWQSRTAHPSPQRGKASQLWSSLPEEPSRSRDEPKGNELCHPTVPSAGLLHQLQNAKRTNSSGEKWFGLNWTGQICLPRPGQRAAVGKAKRHIYLKQSPARETGNFALQMHKLIAHKMFTLAGGTYTNEVLSLPIPTPNGSPCKALQAATKVWDCAASHLKEKQILLAV